MFYFNSAENPRYIYWTLVNTLYIVYKYLTKYTYKQNVIILSKFADLQEKMLVG